MQEKQVKIEGLEELRAAFYRYPDIATEELEAGIWEASLLLQREVAERTSTAHGTLRNSIIAREPVRTNGGVSGTVGTPILYAVPVELGTKPHWAPIDPIMDWVKIKFGISDAKEIRRVAGAVQRKIAVSGTKAQNMFGDTVSETQADVRNIVLGITPKILRRLNDAKR